MMIREIREISDSPLARLSSLGICLINSRTSLSHPRRCIVSRSKQKMRSQSQKFPIATVRSVKSNRVVARLFLAVVVIDILRPDNFVLGRAHEPLVTIRIVAAFADGVIGHDEKNQVL